ncbi:Dihydrofolate reductase [Altererythrobacter epoxidivorans]|uniref:Dihydrofolate reductase n=1 Tax=Altererythrobacter epoxidivorans TaxID=361183 RepID=A0A0M4M2X8_9SPHN|nr:dihydrofolate reductase family protein [Altererythrobacter epoxidivorans]ALE15853.1 Dihydrofolate reductase [Altererythrobacter epoxidivorans]
MGRRIIGAAFLTLDGVMQSPGGIEEDFTGEFDQGGWVFKLGDEGLGETLGPLFSGDYGLLLGRRTYDIFAAYWPYVGDADGGLGIAFTNADKYVLTKGDQPLEWENRHRLRGIEDVAALKDTDGPDLVIQGSSTLYPALLEAGLLDELTTMTFPVLLGKGKRLFGEGTPVRMLEVAEHRITDKGTVITKYLPAGSLPPYPDDAPGQSTSEREAVRQRLMKSGRW